MYKSIAPYVFYKLFHYFLFVSDILASNFRFIISAHIKGGLWIFIPPTPPHFLKITFSQQVCRFWHEKQTLWHKVYQRWAPLLILDCLKPRRLDIRFWELDLILLSQVSMHLFNESFAPAFLHLDTCQVIQGVPWSILLENNDTNAIKYWSILLKSNQWWSQAEHLTFSVYCLCVTVCIL